MKDFEEDLYIKDLIGKNIKLENQNKELKQINKDAIERLKSLIKFWMKYSPNNHHMQVEQFRALISILEGKQK